MELREFVKQSLVDIVAGVSESMNDISQLGGKVNRSFNEREATQDIIFDVAVTASESMTGTGTGGIKVMGMGIEGELSADGKQSITSRLQFKVPVTFPFTREQVQMPQRVSVSDRERI
jgi:hypothetical protein